VVLNVGNGWKGSEAGDGVKEDGAGPPFEGESCGPGPKCSRKEMPVPGIEAVPIKPRGPTFSVNGAPPMLALRPLLERFNLSPGMIVKD